MESNKQGLLLLSFIIILLLIQAVLSSLIIVRLNDNTEILNDINSGISLASNSPQQAGPTYVEGVSIDDDPWLGIQSAPVTIVEFSDYQCPFCAEAADVVEQLLLEYENQILFVYRDFPLEQIHPHAFKAAEAANCAGEQDKYWAMHKLLFANQPHLDEANLRLLARELNLDQTEFDSCLSSGRYVDEVDQDIAAAVMYKVNRVPTFFVNGHRVQGGSYNILRQQIESVLKEAN